MQHRDPWAHAWQILKALFGAWVLIVVVVACVVPLDSLPGWVAGLLVTPGLLATLLHGIAWWSDSQPSLPASTPRSSSDE